MAAAAPAETSVIPELPRCYLSRQTLQATRHLLTKGAKAYLTQRAAATKPGTDEPQTPLEPKQAKQLKKLVKALTKSMLTGMDRHLREKPAEESDIPVAPLDEALAGRVAELEQKVSAEWSRCCELRSSVSSLVEATVLAELDALLLPNPSPEEEKREEEEERRRLMEAWPPVQEVQRLRKMREDVEREIRDMKEDLLPEFQYEIEEFKNAVEIIASGSSDVARLLAQAAEADRELPPPPPVGRLPVMLEAEAGAGASAAASEPLSLPLSSSSSAAAAAAASSVERGAGQGQERRRGMADEADNEEEYRGGGSEGDEGESDGEEESGRRKQGGREPFAANARSAAREAAKPY